MGIKRELTIAQRVEALSAGIMSAQEAAKFCGLSVDTIYDLIHSGELLATRSGRRKMVLRSSVIGYLAARIEAYTPDIPRKLLGRQRVEFLKVACFEAQLDQAA